MATRFLVLMAATAGLQVNSQACMTFFEVNPTPPPPSFKEALLQHENRGVWEGRAKERQEVADKIWDFRTQNNLSVALAHLGKLDEALDRMKTVESTYPNQTATAYNLGTVYELKNNLPQARIWIQEGINRELKSGAKLETNGTEWLHLRILDAKIALNRDPNYLQSHSVSGLDFGEARVPSTPPTFPQGNDGKPLTLLKVQNSIREQLHERMEFVKAPDPVVGDLLFDLGNALEVNEDSQDALEIYEVALPYQPVRLGLAQSRFNYFAGTPNYWLIGALWSLSLGAVGFYLAKRKLRDKQEWRELPVQTLDDVGPEKKTVFIDFSKFDNR